MVMGSRLYLWCDNHSTFLKRVGWSTFFAGLIVPEPKVNEGSTLHDLVIGMSIVGWVLVFIAKFVEAGHQR
jgi:hypothetical protein